MASIDSPLIFVIDTLPIYCTIPILLQDLLVALIPTHGVFLCPIGCVKHAETTWTGYTGQMKHKTS